MTAVQTFLREHDVVGHLTLSKDFITAIIPVRVASKMVSLFLSFFIGSLGSLFSLLLFSVSSVLSLFFYTIDL